jgi:hypothetical protein
MFPLTRPVSNVRVSPASNRLLLGAMPLALTGPAPNLAYLRYLLCVTRRFDLLTVSRVRDPRAPSTVPFC